MALKLLRRGKIWHVRGTVRGQAVFETTGTDERARAEAYRAKREAQLWDRSIFGERAAVPFVQAVVSYLEHRKPGSGDTRRVQRLAEYFRGVALRQIDQNCSATIKLRTARQSG